MKIDRNVTIHVETHRGFKYQLKYVDGVLYEAAYGDWVRAPINIGDVNLDRFRRIHIDAILDPQ